MKKLLLFISAAMAATTVQAQTKWNLDKSHSQVQFTVSHLMISEVTGNFKNFSADLTAGKADFSDAQITFSVDVASINTEDTDRDNHLKSDDFFNAEKYPKMVFKGKTIKKTGNNTYDLTGDLTIRDVTKTITLKVVYLGTVKDPWGNIKAGFKVTGKVNRINYNLKWNALTEAGGMVVGEDVDIVINLEFAQAK